MSLDFTPPPRRPRGESIVPMINVVFLLLVFFLMTSRLAPPAPFEVTPPEADAAGPPPPGAGGALHVSADGEIGFRDLRGDAALAAFAAHAAQLAAQGGAAPGLRADADLDGAAAARLLRRLSAAGVPEAALTVTPR